MTVNNTLCMLLNQEELAKKNMRISREEKLILILFLVKKKFKIVKQDTRIHVLKMRMKEKKMKIVNNHHQSTLKLQNT